MLVSCLKNVSNKFKPVLKLYSQTHVLRTRYKQNNRTFTQIASLHTSSPSLAIYRDTENVYAYNIIQSLPTTKNVPVFSITNSIDNLYDFDNRLNQNWRTKTASEIVDCFKSVLNYCTEHDINLADPRFDKLVDGLMDNIQHLTDSNLCDLFHCLIRLPVCDSYAARNYHDVWSALDDVCCWKLNNWPLETTFVFADYWYRLNLGKLSDFLYNVIDRMSRRVASLSKDELMRLYFFLKIHKRHKLTFEIRHATLDYVGDLSVDEIALVSMVHVKLDTKLKLDLMATTFVAKLKEEARTVPEYCVRNIVQVLRYSSSVLLVDQLMDLLDHLVSEVDRLSNTACTHIALLGTTLQFFHEESLQRVAEKVLRDLSNTEAVRVKDIERLLLALTMFHYTPKTERDIFQAILEEVDRPERRLEFMKFPRSLACVLNFLSIKKMYLHELMSKILDREYILELYGKSPKKLPREIFSLDVCIDVECPDYVGNRLDPTYRRKAAKWLVEYTPTLDQFKKLTAADRFVLDVTDAVAKMVNGNHNLHADHILPNFAKSGTVIAS
ncbi:FAST kinase domain-containing protein 5, mitochondrial isoform X3 [Photinus pyralis]|uniref:FAST kinase domain-containing protein 5, mitochondrial isoform X3 n=1 Tax=Photinus pyralis TaxID=7054 RepID=UPI0012676737|nr:FAST kinase domain-containing protein 5, mitochondrial isoform X3 [Photinus pyralis]